MLASPIFHHSRHIRVSCISFSIFFLPHLPLSLLHIHTRARIGVTFSPFLHPLGSLFSVTTLSFSHARHPSFAAGISHLHSVKTLGSSLIPLNRLASIVSLSPMESILSRFLDPSQFRTPKPNPKRAERYPHYHSCSRQRKVCLEPSVHPLSSPSPPFLSLQNASW